MNWDALISRKEEIMPKLKDDFALDYDNNIPDDEGRSTCDVQFSQLLFFGKFTKRVENEV